jgi:cytochrome c553
MMVATLPSFEVVMRQRPLLTLIVCVLLPALSPTPTNAMDDIDALCLDCHRPGQAGGAVPVIEGQHVDYLRAQLQRFQHRHREGFPMNALSAGLNEAQIETLVGALTSRAWRSADRVEEVDVESGRARLEALDCAGCHGAEFLGGGAIPRIAGQQAAYLERQILGFGDAQRHHPPVGGGVRMYSIDADEAAAIAQALSAMR